ncbi:SH3 domain-containing protein [Spirosoma pomorum]
MKSGATLKTKIGPDKNRDEFFFLYDKPGGKKIGAAKEGTILGTYDRSESRLLTSYAYVKLATPLTGGYRYAYIRENAVYEYSAKKTAYYVNKSTQLLNIRSTPTTASSKNVVGTLKTGDLVGTTDGTTENGFLQFALAKGGTGWVSKNYITTTKPADATAPADDTTDTTESTPVSDPAQAGTVEQSTTAAENRFGTGALNILLWVGIGLIAVAVGITLAKVYGKRNPKKRTGQ